MMERTNYKCLHADQNARYAFILTGEDRRYAFWNNPLTTLSCQSLIAQLH